MNNFRFVVTVVLFVLLNLACSPSFWATNGARPTATPTKTPKPATTATSNPVAVVVATPIPTNTPMPTETAMAVATVAPTDSPTATPTVTVAAPTTTPALTESPTETAVAKSTDTPLPPKATLPPEPTATAVSEFQYRVAHFKVLGDGENNGGVFNKGGQHFIFLTVLDAAGNGLDGVIVKDANGSALEVKTGSKGPGKAEIEMSYEPYKLMVVSDPTGAVTSEVSHQMSTLYPEVADVVGKLGTLENENSVCPTLEVRCTPPFYNVHFSYEITFQKK